MMTGLSPTATSAGRLLLSAAAGCSLGRIGIRKVEKLKTKSIKGKKKEKEKKEKSKNKKEKRHPSRFAWTTLNQIKTKKREPLKEIELVDEGRTKRNMRNNKTNER